MILVWILALLPSIVVGIGGWLLGGYHVRQHLRECPWCRDEYDAGRL